MDWMGREGVFPPGAWADIAGEGDQLRDVRELERVRFVRKGGVVYEIDVRSRHPAEPPEAHLKRGIE